MIYCICFYSADLNGSVFVIDTEQQPWHKSKSFLISTVYFKLYSTPAQYQGVGRVINIGHPYQYA